jgi:aspartate carbamoyltransferase catalytic subunit
MNLFHIIEVQQFKDRGLLEDIFSLSARMEKLDESKDLSLLLPSVPRRKILASLFYEPSTRTRLSFESAMKRLGGDVISTEDAPHFSSAVKGESLTDTIKVVSSFADAIVLRHYEEGSAKRASEVSKVPIINAGDGPGQHPTQALLDLYTIKKELGRIDNLKVCFVGDLLYSRTVHSLVYLLAQQNNIELYFVSPEEIRMPRDIADYLKEKGCPFFEQETLFEVAHIVDILYVTRVQKERFRSIVEYERVKDSYVVDKQITQAMKEGSRILHPLPRVQELPPEIDSDSRSAYFRQADNGLYLRMSLLSMLLKQ